MELDEIKKQKIEAMQQAQLEGMKKTILQRFLTKEARERLSTVRMANQQLAEQVEMALMEAAQSGQLNSQISDEKLKDILNRATGTKRGFTIIK